jgi:acetyltransferase-like isoleucine patch superfamily enzyme
MITIYGFLGTIKMVLYYINTKLFFQNSRLIRLPIDIRNKKNIDFGKQLTTGHGCRIEAYPLDKNSKTKTLVFGSNIQINDYVHITAMESVKIGNNVLMASKIYISDCSHGSYSGNDNDSNPESVPQERPLFSKPVVIEDNVWLGEFVSVLPGVTIGKGSIIGANSVVSRDIPPNVIAVGSPAKPMKKFNFENNIWEKI